MGLKIEDLITRSGPSRRALLAEVEQCGRNENMLPGPTENGKYKIKKVKATNKLFREYWISLQENARHKYSPFYWGIKYSTIFDHLLCTCNSPDEGPIPQDNPG